MCPEVLRTRRRPGSFTWAEISERRRLSVLLFRIPCHGRWSSRVRRKNC